MGADVHLMNICTVLNSSAFNGLCAINPPLRQHSTVSCYFTDHSESLDLTINLSSSTFDSGQRKATVLVCSLYLGLAPEPCRVPPLVSFLFFIYKVAIIIFKFVPSCVCHIFDFVLIFIFFKSLTISSGMSISFFISYFINNV